MYILYKNSIVYILPKGIGVKIYADDIKIYSSAETSVDRNGLQAALYKFEIWARSLDLKLSVDKCAIVHFGHGNLCNSYEFGGAPLKAEKVMRDLGVITSLNLKYSDHVSDVVLRASRRANWILRSFIVRDVEVFCDLFKIYVLPIICYASPVWSPGLKKDRDLIEKVVNRFRKRVSYRCQVEKDHVPLVDVFNVLEDADLKVFKTIKSRHPVLAENMFDFRNSSTRRDRNVLPKSIASKKVIDDLFCWRVSRVLRNY